MFLTYLVILSIFLFIFLNYIYPRIQNFSLTLNSVDFFFVAVEKCLGVYSNVFDSVYHTVCEVVCIVCILPMPKQYNLDQNSTYQLKTEVFFEMVHSQSN